MQHIFKEKVQSEEKMYSGSLISLNLSKDFLGFVRILRKFFEYVKSENTRLSLSPLSSSISMLILLINGIKLDGTLFNTIKNRI